MTANAEGARFVAWHAAQAGHGSHCEGYCLDAWRAATATCVARQAAVVEPRPRPSLDVAAVRKRVKAAYPGPWFFNSYSAIHSGCCRRTGRDDHDERGFNTCPLDAEHDDDCVPTVAWVPSVHGDTADPQSAADAEFIAHAREDVPALLAALTELEREVATKDRALKQYADRRNWFQTTYLQGGDFPVKVWAWDDAREPWSMATQSLAALDQQGGQGE